MTSTNAERQRRYRLHKAGDHSECSPDRACRAKGEPAETPVTGSGYGPGGDRLWRELGGERLDGGTRVLAIEACRMVDRLDRLHEMLAVPTHEWMFVVKDPQSGSLVLLIDKVVAEARLMATALKAILAELRQRPDADVGADPAPAPSPTPAPAPEATPEAEVEYGDQLAARRAARIADAKSRQVS